MSESMERARRWLGIGSPGAIPPLLPGIRTAGGYPLVALTLLSLTYQLQIVVVLALGPEIAGTLGAGPATISVAIAANVLAVHGGMFLFARAVETRPQRAAVAARSAVVWSFFTFITAFAASGSALLGAVAAGGVARGAVRAIHPPLLFDAYGPGLRGRILGVWSAAEAAGYLLGAGAVALAYVTLELTWRGTFLFVGVLSFLVALAAERLRDPGFGVRDHGPLRDDVTGSPPLLQREVPPLGLSEITRRLNLVPSFRRLVVAYAFLGVLLIPFNSFLFAWLDRRWDVTLVGRSLTIGAMWALAVPVLWWTGRRIEISFRHDPGAPIRLASWAVAVGGVAIAIGAFVPVLPVAVAFMAVAVAATAAVFPATSLPLLSFVPPRHRPHALALLNTIMAVVGGLGGTILLGGLDRRIGLSAALATLLIPAIVTSRRLRTAAAGVADDIDELLVQVIDDERLQRTRSAGGHVPLLQCQGIDFSYGQLQVLFGVDFTVDEGEMVALLGTNGAGKSTLLRVISGLGIPSRGSVHFRGDEITYLDPERRVGRGLVQIPGGRAVFPPMSVIENLRVYGFAFDRDTKAVERGIEQTFEALPRLYERRDQPASTLSGGEQQMLALGKAFILRPRLLLIDELSLGLAPIIVADLLDMVRRINATGTAVVLVEQSVNIALSVVAHAYFMERGEIRFDGRAAELLERPDLVRSVFLEGARGERPQDS